MYRQTIRQTKRHGQRYQYVTTKQHSFVLCTFPIFAQCNTVQFVLVNAWIDFIDFIVNPIASGECEVWYRYLLTVWYRFHFLGMVPVPPYGTSLNVHYGGISYVFAVISQNQTLQKPPLQPKWPLHNPFEGCPEGFHVSGLAPVMVLGAKMGELILKIQKYVAMACTAVCGTSNLN